MICFALGSPLNLWVKNFHDCVHTKVSIKTKGRQEKPTSRYYQRVPYCSDQVGGEIQMSEEFVNSLWITAKAIDPDDP